MVIGIPRGLFYYKYKTFWQVFFSQLGINIIYSNPTNQSILDDGISSCISEACMPLKAYIGHVIDIKDNVDALFIPRFTSISRREYICPKFGGLPNIVHWSINNTPILLDTEVNMHKRNRGSYNAAISIGNSLGINSLKCREAYLIARDTYRKERLDSLGIPISKKKKDDNLNILLMGHVYMVYDKFLNLNLVNKLELLGAQVWALESFDSRALKIASSNLNKPMFWNYGSQALGCAYQLLDSSTIDGIIYLTCFGCGIDSFVGYMVERRLNKQSIPFTTISIDEHTGKAGIDTRLEAFIDTIIWRKGHENRIPTHGQCIYSS